MHGRPILPLKLWPADDLVVAAQRGEDAAVEYLITEYPPMRSLIASLKHSVDPRNVAPTELEAAARLAVIEALRGFDPRRGVRFTTYAYYYIRGEMLNALYPHVERRRDAEDQPGRVRLVSLDRLADEEPDGTDGYEAELLNQDPD